MVFGIFGGSGCERMEMTFSLIVGTGIGPQGLIRRRSENG